MNRNEIPSLVKIINKIGMDKYEELCNIADVAIVEDNLRLNQRLVFINDVEAMYPNITLEELTEVFIFRLKIMRKHTWHE